MVDWAARASRDPGNRWQVLSGSNVHVASSPLGEWLTRRSAKMLDDAGCHQRRLGESAVYETNYLLCAMPTPI